MNSSIDNYAKSVSRILDRGSRTANDFVGLAIAGEQLRRASALGDPSRLALATVERYERELGSFSFPSREFLESGIAAATRNLSAYAASPRSDRDPANGQAILLQIDELLSVAAAEVRAGALLSNQATALARALAESAHRISAQCSELAQFAEDQQLLFGNDSEMPALFGWWEELARFAPSRLAVQRTVSEAARREHRIAKAVAAFEAAHSRSLFDRLSERFLQTLRALVPAQHALRATYADEVRLPDRHDELFDEDGFSIFRSGEHIVFKVTNEHRLKPVNAAFRGQKLALETLDDTSFRVVVPVTAGVLTFEMLVDGARVSHSLEFFE